MSKYFFDTSAIVKRYHKEDGSDLIDRLFAESDAEFVGRCFVISYFTTEDRSQPSTHPPCSCCDSAQALRARTVAAGSYAAPGRSAVYAKLRRAREVRSQERTEDGVQPIWL